MKDEIKGIERILATSGKYITYAERCYVLDYITNLQEENNRLKELDENYPIEEQLEEALKRKNIYKSRNEKAINEVIRVLQIILEQPSENKLDDLWIINKLEGIQTLLQGEDKDDN